MTSCDFIQLFCGHLNITANFIDFSIDFLFHFGIFILSFKTIRGNQINRIFISLLIGLFNRVHINDTTPVNAMKPLINSFCCININLHHYTHLHQKEIASSIDSIGILLDIIVLPHTLQIMLFLSSLRYALSEIFR